MLDPETSTLSWDCFKFLLELEGQKAIRYAYFFSILTIEIDHLKVGELVPTIAGKIRQGIRNTDLIGRVGHQQFSVILHHAEVQNIYSVGERIRKLIENNGLVHKNDQNKQTVSIGGACFPTHTADSQELLLTANTMLQKAKSTGGNRVYFLEM